MSVRIGIVGFGTVGQGFLEVLLKKGAKLPVKIVGIAGRSKGEIFNDTGIDPAAALDCVKMGKTLNDCFVNAIKYSPLELIKNGNLDILIEATPTNLIDGEPAYTYIKTALQSGVDVITANKGPIALHYHELKNIGRTLRFEATVMSGTPVIGFIEDNLKSAEILGFRGILNGTTNYILTEMAKGKTYEYALKEAQRLGYAETDPTADVEGFDSLAKILILANVFMNATLSPDDVKREGITSLTAPPGNAKWKLIATAIKRDDRVEAKVMPEKVTPDDPLYYVDGTENALLIKTDILGTILLKGPGAGRIETGYAIFLDLLKVLEKRGNI